MHKWLINQKNTRQAIVRSSVSRRSSICRDHISDWCCLFNCCMQSYVASSCVYILGANVQVEVSRFRSFDAAYEGSVLLSLHEGIVHSYVHTYLLDFTISA